ncbi:MAG: Gfo/Idh/MocA family oxidoreductase, partial [Clostridiaceae bacterium]|nr:Gfo/Idh/MocA family oxidoreductase [Clostridiaceae bacterium]
CDIYSDRVEENAKTIFKKYGKKPFVTTDYYEIIENDSVDAVIITTPWSSHIDIAIEAMKKHKPVGIEVGGAYSIEECWNLVRTYQETKTPIMMLENCCYGRKELLVLNMVKKGLFGKVVHCAGGYHHDLRNQIAFGTENRHYRLDDYIKRNCENYPTHELGPIAKILNINKGNRMVSLTSTASKAAGMHEYIKKEKPDDQKLMNTVFNQGDIVTTVIKCAGGETITLTFDTTLPRYYSRGLTVRGTDGMYEECTDSVFLNKVDEKYDFSWKDRWNNVEEYYEKYEHPIWKNYLQEGIKGGHDGMDWLVFDAFLDSIINKTPCPIDVYDTASWMCISVLSEQSIEKGSAPVSIPDFTNGKWIK